MRAKPLRADKLTLGLQLILVLGVPWILLHVISRRQPVSSLPAQIKQLELENPTYYFVGNSMLSSRIDARLFSELSGKPTSLNALGSSRVAHWFLILKNVVLASSVRPKKIFVFFRDGELTDLPEGLDTFARRELATLLQTDESLPRVGGWKGVKFALAQAIETPLTDLRDWAREETQPAKANQLFDAKPIRASVREESLAFKGESFLPLLLRLPLPLVFVRVKRNPSLPPPRDLEKYLERLNTFFRAHAVSFYDLGADPGITSEMFTGDDHLLEEFRPLYTRIFFERLAKELR